MRIAQVKVLQLEETLQFRRPLTDFDLDQIETHLRVCHKIFPLKGRVRELVIEHIIYIQEGLTLGWQRWLRAHALGHILLHSGNQTNFACIDTLALRKQERQAELFAGFLLLGDPASFRPETTAWDLAEWTGVPVEKVVNWLSLITPEVALTSPPTLRVIR